ncbi:MAG: endonuclease MutS2 [Bacteroidota bacterium]
MRCHHENTFEKLGFDQILIQAEKRALSAEGKAVVASLVPVKGYQQVWDELVRVNEFRELLMFGDPFPMNRLRSVGSTLEKAAIKGNWLGASELFDLLDWLRTIEAVKKYFKSREEKYPHLHQEVNPHPFNGNLVSAIEQVLDARGNVKDNASPALAKIRKEMSSGSKELRVVLNRVLRKAKENKWSEDQEITIRNDRLVIPVKAEAKNRISGFVQDVSQSGQTVFVEPAEALALNNRMKELQIKEQNEIIRILTELTAIIHAETEGLETFRYLMTRLDSWRARALLAVDLKAVLPVVNPDSKEHQLREAYYPLLLIKNFGVPKEDRQEVVPLDLNFSEENRIVVISGPNAGGKSVSLKTLGLLQIMLQAGFLVPVDERSEFRLFDSLFMDIGDEQSVESDLSTYTSHLFQLRKMGDRMTHNSLFLIDEFGSGTDPRMGGAIAEAFLNRFVRQGAYGIITTHYSNIKEYAELNEGTVNAAMQFDTKELKPTYKLLEGVPGRSYAFEIAKRVGVHYTILRLAKRLMGKKQLSSEALLRQLEQKNQESTRLLEENRQKEKHLNKLLKENERLNLELQKNRKKLIREAQQEARQLVKDANKRIEKTIREIREKNAEKNVTKKLRQELEASAPVVEPAIVEEPKPSAPKKQNGEEVPALEPLPGEVPQVGDFVKMQGNDSFGQIQELKGNRAVVAIGDLKVTTKLKQLVKIKPPNQEKKVRVSVARSKPLGSTRTELDIMGMRVEEALPAVEKFLDEALMGNLTYLRILHGKGSGALRDGVRNYLRDQGRVSKIKDASIEAGGSGWTVVELKN